MPDDTPNGESKERDEWKKIVEEETQAKLEEYK
jgi:hypothetical protein